ncbi:helix-hairpin-helix domain-containing protein [Pseudarthrobacter sp. NPDC058329]|uniref:ComEA family DNA-binding protein n=1 Tax=Pseudarthrobacter sp. NPDC058329 TaxID=3346448 RepID=UPI0036DB16C7
MSRRNAGAAGERARHARTRLQATLGDSPRGLLLGDDGGTSFEYRGAGTDEGGKGSRTFPADEPEAKKPPDVGPAVRWRLSFRLGVLLGVLAVAAGAWFWWQAAAGQPEILPLSGMNPGTTAPAEDSPSGEDSGGGSRAGPEPDTQESAPAGAVVVHVAGSVLRPGVVELPGGSRVHEAIAAAGGAAPGADLNRLNLAVVVEDGQKIHVPQHGEALPAGPGDAGAPGVGEPPDGSAGASAGSKINLNTAGVEELDGLPKVGPVLAQRIVDWRREHGPFKAVEDLDAVDGVGPKMLEALLPLVTI